MIGSHIAFALTSKGQQVRALKRKGASTAETEKIFRFYSSAADELFRKIEWVEGDVLDIGSLEDAMAGCQFVYHAAAIVSFDPRERDFMLKVNGEGTANVINAALAEGVRKLCHVSSVAALGRTPGMQNLDEDTWWKNDPANSWYAISKYTAEREAWRAAEEGLDVVIVNPAVVIGPGNTTRSSNAIFGMAKKGFPWYTKGSGGFVDARDVADACVTLMESDLANQRFILSAENISYRDFANELLKRFGHPPASREVGSFQLGLLWRLDKLGSLFSGNSPRITKESATSASEAVSFNGNKITDVTAFRYRDLRCSLDEITPYYR